MLKEKDSKPKKQSHPLEGISIAVVFFWWGLVSLYSQYYLHINGAWRWLPNILGGIAILISFVGAVFELGKLWKNQISEYLGVSIVFLIPAVCLHFVIDKISPNTPWEITGKIFVLIMAAFGGMFLIMALPYFFWKPVKELKSVELSEEEAAKQRAEKRKADVNTIMALIIALLSFAAGLVKLILELGK